MIWLYCQKPVEQGARLLGITGFQIQASSIEVDSLVFWIEYDSGVVIRQCRRPVAMQPVQFAALEIERRIIWCRLNMLVEGSNALNDINMGHRGRRTQEPCDDYQGC